VLADLADLGFDAEWCVLGADDVGATHRRKRLWVLAYRDPDGRELLGRSGVLDGERSACGCDADGCGGEAVADSKRASVRIESGWLGGAIGSGEAESRHDRAGVEHATREHGSEGWEPGSEATTRRLGGAGAGVGDAALSGLQGRGELADAGCRDGRRWSDGEGEERAGSAVDGCRSVWPPGPSDLHAWRAVQADTQPSVCRVAHGVPAELVDRVDRLRALGNGVVPLAAAHAFRILAARAMSNTNVIETSAA
jgi:DNA (cytosine-5)-methyltransferase 1